jgi:hypothetical protein
MKKVIGFALFLALASAGPAFGASIKCTTSDTPTGSPFPWVIVGNLDVPAGQSCTLLGHEITGQVTVEGFLGSAGTKFDGNVTVTGGTINLMNGAGPNAAIAGNLTITSSAGISSIGCPNSSNVILGNLNYTNSAGILYVCQASVGGTVNVNNNARINNDYQGWWSADLNNITAGKPIICSGNSPLKGTNLSAPQVTGDCAPFVKQ